MNLKIVALIFALSMGWFIYNVWQAQGNLPDEMLMEIIEPVNTSINRLVILIVVSMLAFLNMNVASAALSDADATALTSLFSLGPIQIGVYDMILYIMVAWTFAPLVIMTVKISHLYYKYGQEAATDEFWEESA
jgi:hypothetical protein